MSDIGQWSSLPPAAVQNLLDTCFLPKHSHDIDKELCR